MVKMGRIGRRKGAGARQAGGRMKKPTGADACIPSSDPAGRNRYGQLPAGIRWRCRQAFWLTGARLVSYLPRLPAARIATVAWLRRSFPITAMAGMRWNGTIFPFNAAAWQEVSRRAPAARFSLCKTEEFVNFPVAGCRMGSGLPPAGGLPRHREAFSVAGRCRTPPRRRALLPAGGRHGPSSVYCVCISLQISILRVLILPEKFRAARHVQEAVRLAGPESNARQSMQILGNWRSHARSHPSYASASARPISIFR